MERERDAERYLRAEIERMGGLFLKWTSPGCDGVPDRIVLLPGRRVIFVEMKTKTGRLSRVQEYMIRKLIGIGQQVCVVYGKAAAADFADDLRKYVVSSGEYFGGGDWQGLEDTEGR